MMKRFSKGFTFTEIIVAMAVGTALILTVLNMFVTNKRAYTANKRLIEMNENVRFALSSMIKDLENTGFYGGSDTITGESGFAETSCDYTTDSIATSVETNYPVWGKSSSKIPSCLNGAITSGTDYISIRGVRGDNKTDATLTTNSSNNQYGKKVFIRTGGKDGVFTNNTINNTVANATDMNWEYYSNIYFVCQNRLLRKTFYNNTTSNQTAWMLEVLAGPDLADLDPKTATCSSSDTHTQSGIERLNIYYGIDSTKDGVVDYYASGDNVALADLNKAIEVKIHVLARSERDGSFTDAKSYDMGGVSAYTPSDKNYHRKLYIQTIMIRSNWNRIINDPSVL